MVGRDIGLDTEGCPRTAAMTKQYIVGFSHPVTEVATQRRYPWGISPTTEQFPHGSQDNFQATLTEALGLN